MEYRLQDSAATTTLTGIISPIADAIEMKVFSHIGQSAVTLEGVVIDRLGRGRPHQLAKMLIGCAHEEFVFKW